MPLPMLPIIAGGVATAIAFFVKHPIITKMLVFPFFIGIILFAISFIKDLVIPYVQGNSLMALASYLGVLDGINIFLTIIIAGFGTKQVLAFIRS